MNVSAGGAGPNTDLAAKVLRRHLDIDQLQHKACGCGWDSATEEDAEMRWADHVARLLCGPPSRMVKWVTA